MEKIIIIDGKQVKFKSTAATPLRYKAQFKSDFFSDLIKLSNQIELGKDKKTDLSAVDYEVFYRIIWTLAKTANKDIPDLLTWLDEFESFSLADIMQELQELLISSIQSKKK